MIRIGNKVVAGSADVDLSTVLKSLNKTGLSIWIGTQTEHDALAESVKNNEKTTFITYDTDEDVFLIIDTIVSYGKTWSSVKISSELAKKINASDVYTKEQVDEIINAKLASALKYRGAVNTTALLPGSAENGDTYFVKADGFMYAYNSTTSTWDALGTVADMTNYFTKTEITAMLQDKADKFQYDVLPTPSSETVGVLLQYTGADTEDYKNSYFYKGIDKGNDTYGWELAKICDCYSKSEVDDSGLCAHGDNAPFLVNSTIIDYLTGLDAKYKFATFTVDQDNATVSDKVNTTQWFSYSCYRQNASWKVTAADSSTGKEIYTTDISAGNPVSWSKLATTSDMTYLLKNKMSCYIWGTNKTLKAVFYEITDRGILPDVTDAVGKRIIARYGNALINRITQVNGVKNLYWDNTLVLSCPWNDDTTKLTDVLEIFVGITDWQEIATKSDLTASTDITLTTYTNSAFSIIELKAVRLGLNTIQVAGILEINNQCETLTFASGLPSPKVVTISPHSMQIQAMCYRGTSSGASERVLINKDGSMTVYTNTSGGNLYFSCEYTCI